MPGVIERYRDRLPFAPEDPIVSLQEGSTPLVLAPRLSERVGAEVWCKLEGANPTGSFKDRGMTCAVSAAGRELAQALIHGARVIALRGNFDQALELVRELARRHPIALVNSVNEFRIEGQKTAAFELLEALDGELHAVCIPVGNAGNITAYWRGFTEAGQRPRVFG